MTGRGVVALIVLLAATAALLCYGILNHFPEEASLEISAVPWGILVPGYVFFALMATGSSIVNSIYTVFGYRGPGGGFERVIKYGVWFSLATIVPAWILILADLTHREDILWMILGFHPVSRVAWMMVLYALFAITLAVELVYMIRSEVNERLRQMKGLELAIAVAVLVVTIAVHSNLGQVFGTIIAVPAWYGPHLAAYFIASAVLIGAAGQFLYVATVKAFRGRLSETRDFHLSVCGKLYLVGIPVLAFFMIWNAITAWYNSSAWSFYEELIRGEYALEYWGVEVIAGLLTPLALTIIAVKRRSLAPLVAASVLLLIAGFASKYSLIVLGQLARLGAEGSKSLLGLAYMTSHYTPTTSELLILAGGILAWPTILLLGTLLLPLDPGEKPRRLWILK